MTTLTHRTARITAASHSGQLSLGARLRHRIAFWRSRRALGELTAAQLDDIGLTAQEAACEARRGIWDAPANWRD